MFLIRKLVPSLNIEGRRKHADIIYVETKNSIMEEVDESVTLRGGLAHSTAGGLVAVFLSPDNASDVLKAAVEILQKSKGLGIRAKVGINSGDLIVQELPTGIVKYASLGNSVSFARKIAKIENAIVVSDDVHKRLGSQFRSEKVADGWLIKGIVVENW